MKKLFIILSIILVSTLNYANELTSIKESARSWINTHQEVKNHDYSKIDNHARSIISYTGVNDLHNQLTSVCSNDIEKVRAFYIWIAYNVIYENNNYSVLSYVDNIIIHKKGDCDVIAIFFNELCKLSGIESYVIVGNVGNVNGEHAWNIFEYKGKYYSLDATWALYDKLKVYTDVNMINYQIEYYFCCPPSLMSNTHYPKEYFENNRGIIDFDGNEGGRFKVDEYGFKDKIYEYCTSYEPDKVYDIFDDVNIMSFKNIFYNNMVSVNKEANNSRHIIKPSHKEEEEKHTEYVYNYDIKNIDSETINIINFVYDNFDSEYERKEYLSKIIEKYESTDNSKNKKVAKKLRTQFNI